MNRELHKLVGGKPGCEWENCENTATHGLETEYGRFGLWYLCDRHVATVRMPQPAPQPAPDDEERSKRLYEAGRLCFSCLGEFEPEELTTIDHDPGDAEVGPDPDIVTLCVQCQAL